MTRGCAIGKTGRKEYKMESITLKDFQDHVICAESEYLMDNSDGSYWDAKTDSDGNRIYINSFTGEVLFQDEIEKWHVVGMTLNHRHDLTTWIEKDA